MTVLQQIIRQYDWYQHGGYEKRYGEYYVDCVRVHVNII